MHITNSNRTMHKEETERGLSGSRAPEKGERERDDCVNETPPKPDQGAQSGLAHTQQDQNRTLGLKKILVKCAASHRGRAVMSLWDRPGRFSAGLVGGAGFRSSLREMALCRHEARLKKIKHRHSPHLRPNAARHQLIFYCYVFLLKGNEVARSEKGLSAGST